MIEKSLPEPSTRKFTKDLKSKETKPQTYYYLPPKSVDPTFKSTEVDAHFNKLKKEENELLSFYEKAPFQKKNTMPSPSSISTARSNLKKKNLTEKKKGTLPKKNNTPTPITTSKNGSSLSSNLSHLSPSTSLSNLMKTSRLSKPKLQRYLTHYGRYPEAYRVMIWRYLLKLPENKTAFHHFYDQPIHPAYVHFYETFPIKSSSLAQATQRILSCLAYWSPLFENLVYLPPLVFPIVKTCYPDVLTAFEVSLMVILNVCQRWWEYYPNPPIDCLVYAEDMVKDLDPVLYDHFRCYGIGPHEYLWPCFQTLFSETLRKEHWWMFMDHLFTYQSTSFLYVFAAHVLKSYRSALLRLQSGQHVLRFMTRLHPLNVKLSELDPNSMMSISTALFPSSFVTLSEEMYPLFTGYPTCIVAYESKLYAQIRSEEEAYLRRRHVVKEWLQLKQRLDLDQQRWERSDWRVNDMLEKWWNTLLTKESEHQSKKEQVHLLERQMEAMASHHIADARARFIDQHQGALEQRNVVLTQAALTASMLADRRVKDKALEKEMEVVRNEWEKRWKELSKARKEMEEVERIRMAKLVEKIEDLHQLD